MIVRVALEIASAMSYLHHIGILHSDLNGEQNSASDMNVTLTDNSAFPSPLLKVS